MSEKWPEIFLDLAEYLTFIPAREDYVRIASHAREPEAHTGAKAFDIFARRIGTIAAYEEGLWGSFCQGYQDIFYNTRGWDIPLWGSSWRSKKALLLDVNTLAIRELYESWGLSVRESLCELCDHIGIEFAFAAFLSALGTEKAGLSLRRFIDEEISFLLDHILQMISGLTCLEEIHYETVELLGLVKNIVTEYRDRDTEEINGLEQARELVGGFFREYAPSVSDDDVRIINTAGRHNCGGRCFFQGWVKKGSVLKIRFDPARTPCVKYCSRGHGYLSSFLSHRRVRYPMKRIGDRGEGKFQRISWEEAIDTISAQWKRITAKYGPESRYINVSSGVSAMARPDVLVKRLASLDGGFLDKYNSYSAACAEVTTPYIYGTNFTGNSSSFLAKSRLIILWAHNPRITISGAYLMDELVRARKQGTRIIVIDPRYNATAKKLDAEWYPLRPGTDSALGDAMAYVIIKEGLEDRHFMDTHCLGFDENHMPPDVPAGESYEAYLFGKKDGVIKTPEWGSSITGLEAERIVELARSYATAKPAALIPGYGAQRHSNGEQSVRSAAMLACLTGNVGVEGGGAAGIGGIKNRPIPAIPIPENPYKAVIPSFLWTDAIVRSDSMSAKNDGIHGVEKLRAPIKMILSLAGNALINQHSEANRSAAILRDTDKCEFILVSDVFMTASARFADILLPATSFLETPNIVYPINEGNYLLHNNPLVSPLFESRFEYDWLKELARSIGLYEEFTQGYETVDGWLQYAYEKCAASVAELPPYDKFRQDGGYFYPEPARFVAFREQIEDPQNHPFPTPSGKVEIFSKRLYDLECDDIPGLPAYTPGFENSSDPLSALYPFQLIGYHTRKRTHSIHDNNPWMDKLGPPAVLIHPDDAETRGIGDGELVEIWNARGRIKIPARLTKDILRGVIALSQGGWFTPDKEGVDIRGNINTLTTQRPTPLAKGNPQHSNLVDIRAAGN